MTREILAVWGQSRDAWILVPTTHVSKRGRAVFSDAVALDLVERSPDLSSWYGQLLQGWKRARGQEPFPVLPYPVYRVLFCPTRWRPEGAEDRDLLDLARQGVLEWLETTAPKRCTLYTCRTDLTPRHGRVVIL